MKKSKVHPGDVNLIEGIKVTAKDVAPHVKGLVGVSSRMGYRIKASEIFKLAILEAFKDKLSITFEKVGGV